MKKKQILWKKVIFLSTYVRNKPLYIEAMINNHSRFCGSANFPIKAPFQKQKNRTLLRASDVFFD